MRATGVIRRIDDLGRISIPKEVRRLLGIKDGCPMEIYYNQKKSEILLKKWTDRETDTEKLRLKIEQLIEELEDKTGNRHMNDVEYSRHCTLNEVLELIDEM